MKTQIFVGMMEFTKATKDENQYTIGIYPCVAAGFYNKESKESYMFHYPTIKRDDLESKLEIIKNDLGEKLEITVCGGGYSKNDSENYKNHIEKSKKITEELIYKKFPESNIKIEWNKENIAANLYLKKEIDKFSIIYKETNF